MAEIGFQTSERKGFHVTFENGWTVSVQFGYGNYCSNRDWRGNDPGDIMSCFNSAAPKSPTAEIAAWDANGEWHQFDGDAVEGWQSPAQVLAFMNMIAGLPGTPARAAIAKATGQ